MPIPKELLNWNRTKWESKNLDMYSTQESNTWAWYHSDLDEDIDALTDRLSSDIHTVLDLGTCSGPQAIGLAKKGYDVIGSDVSKSALEQAEKVLSQLDDASLKLKFVIDDIISTQFSDDQFDLILDRGCYHSICCFAHTDYIHQIKRILRPDGYLLLKTMSSLEQRFNGWEMLGNERIPMPYKFDRVQLTKLFAESFEIVSITDSYFYSSVTQPPARAILTVLRNSR